MAADKKILDQSTLSIFLLALLVAIALVILVLHSRYVAPPLPGFINNTPVSDTRVKQVFTFTAPPLFKKMGLPEMYDAEGLFEKINGKAPLYIESGFVKLHSQRFVKEDDQSQWYELYLYDMGKARSAFAVFSVQSRFDGKHASSLTEYDHYLTENGLFLRLGNYYVECIGSSDEQLLQKAMVDTLLSFQADNSIEHTPLKEMAIFPEEDLVPGTINVAAREL